MALKFIRQVLAGKSIGRILLNRTLREECSGLSGRVIDLAGGNHPSYRSLLPKEIEFITTDYKAAPGVGVVVDLNQTLPFDNDSVSTFLCFNALYILDDRERFLKEVHRTLAPHGKLFLSSPFITNEMPEPHDFVRLTHEGLLQAFKSAQFSKVSIIPYGERATAAMYLLHPLFFLSIIRLPFYALAVLVDALLPQTLKKKHPAPIGYFVIAEK